MYKVLTLCSLLFIAGCGMVLSPFYSKQRDEIFTQGFEIYKKKYLVKEELRSFYEVDKAINKSIVYFKGNTLSTKFFKKIDLTKKVIYFNSNSLKVVQRLNDGSLVSYNNKKNNGIYIVIQDFYNVDGYVINQPMLLRSNGMYNYNSKQIYYFTSITLLNNMELTEDYLKFLDLSKKWQGTHYSDSLRSTIIQYGNFVK